MEKVSFEQVQTVVKTMAKVAEENKDWFCELDGVMGDADFGISLSTGFGNVMAKWDTYNMTNIGTFLMGVTQAITSVTGGCSGPVWGTLFMRNAMAYKGMTELTLPDIVKGLTMAIEGISSRGGAKLGDKTLLDALDVIVKSLQASIDSGDEMSDAFDKAAKAAYDCRETTKDWVAMRGRQSFTGERSRGTYDPGIVAIGEMAVAIAEVLK